MAPSKASSSSNTAQDSDLGDTREVLFAISHDLLGSIGRDDHFTVLNPAWEKTLGFSNEVLMARPFIEFVHPDDQKTTRDALTELWDERSDVVDFTIRYMVQGGGWRHLSWYAEPHGELIYFVAHDITDQIASSHRNYLMANMVEGMDDAIFTKTTQNVVTSWNANCEEIYGFSPEEAIGQSIGDLIVPSDRQDEPIGIVERLLGGEGVRQFSTERQRKDGSMVRVSQTASLMRDPDHHVLGVVVVSRDITDLDLEDSEVRGEFDMVAWVGRVRDAIDEDRIHFYAQPIISLHGKPVSYEFLCRMENRDGVVISPGRFIPAAENYGLIEELDLLGVREAARQIAKGHLVSVNISTATIRRRHIVDVIAEELSQAGADPSGLTLEITETALMKSLASGERFTKGLIKLGVRIALDDFGTGFGGFTYLKRLPIDRLKIDVEFVRDLRLSRASQHVVKAVVALAEGFHLDTVAEGVEDEESAKLLVAYGVSHVQGSLYAKPGPIGEVIGNPVTLELPDKQTARADE